MKVLITAYGTRGDIQPYIAFGKGLLRAGYQVAICTSEGYRPLVEEHAFFSDGGQSWSIPYIGGVYALAIQVMPNLTPEEF